MAGCSVDLMMPFEPILARWHSVVERWGDQLAISIPSTGDSWTFAQLSAAVMGRTAEDESAVVLIQSQGFEFIVELLSAWQRGRLVAPLEPAHVFDPSQLAGLRDAVPSAILAKVTSGTTGTPRIAAFSAKALIADCDQIISTMGLKREWPNVAAISLAHSYGFSNLVLPLLLAGIPLILVGSPLPASISAAFPSGPCTLPGVPAMWKAWHSAGILSRDAIALAISAGAPLPLELEDAVFADTGVKIHNFYGASECGGIAYDRSQTPRRLNRIVGTAMDGVALSIEENGCLTVTSKATALCYWPIENPSAVADGGYATQDLGILLEDGSVKLVGRSSDVINVAGRKVHPAEIESLIRQLPAVIECLVFGIPALDATRGEEIVALVASADASAIYHLKEKLGSALPSWKCPRHWFHEPSLTADGRGKFSRRLWREKLIAQGSLLPHTIQGGVGPDKE